MSSEMYSTTPSIIAALALCVPPPLMGLGDGRFDAIVLGVGWVGFCVGVLLVSMAVWISWSVGLRGIVLQCPIITGIGAALGFLGWMLAGNAPLLWATGILLFVLAGVTLYTFMTKSLR
jgi:hypothetical protein